MATPWIEGTPEVTAERIIHVVDVDECTYDGSVKMFQHNCHGVSQCRNIDCFDLEPNENGDLPPGFECTCPPGYEPDGAGDCVDRRPPSLECKTKGCETVYLSLVKGFGAVGYITDSDGIQWLDNLPEFEDQITDDDILSLIESFQPDMIAFDAVVTRGEDGVLSTHTVDLDNIVPGKPVRRRDLEREESLEQIWLRSYRVSDDANNEAQFDITFHIATVNSKSLEHLISTESREPSSGGSRDNEELEDQVQPTPSEPTDATHKDLQDKSTTPGSFSIYLCVLVVLTYITVRLAVKFLRAIQCLLVPASLRFDRQSFESGMDTLLFVQSLGTLSLEDRKKISRSKWAKIA